MQTNKSSDILLVASKPHDRARIMSILYEHGCQCVEAATDVEADYRLRHGRFDVVVSDVSHGDEGGARLLRSVAKLSEQPKVVLISDETDDGGTRSAFRRGVYDIIPKPIDGSELRAVIESALADSRAEQTTAGRRRTRITQPSAERDSATGLLTRRAFVDALRKTRAQCREKQQPACMVAITGRGAAEKIAAVPLSVQEEIAGRIARCLRRLGGRRGAAVRYDTNCFMLLLSNTDESSGMKAAFRLRAMLSNPSIVNGGSPPGAKYALGVAAMEPGFIISEDDLIQRALAAAAEANSEPVRWSRLPAPAPSRRSLGGAQIDEVCGWINKARQQLKRGHLESTLALVAAVEAKEPFARRHAYIVSGYCEEIAQRMRLPQSQIETIKTAALLHDIGKIGVPDAILRKPGRLTAVEFDQIKKHPATALDILSNASSFGRELPIILHHHERFDGSGYPAGLTGDDIPLGARILNVADALDAMHSSRVYDDGRSIERIRLELARCTGTQFDPDAAEVTLKLLDSRPELLVRQA